MFSFKGVKEQSPQDIKANWEKSKLEASKQRAASIANIILTPEQQYHLDNISNLTLEFPDACKDLVEKCSMKKLFRDKE